MSLDQSSDDFELENLTKKELLNIANKKGIEGVNTKTTNAQLIEKIKSA